MKKYSVLWRYKSSLGGPWMKGDLIELDEDLAEAINKDSPGVLKEAKTAKNDAPGGVQVENRLGSAEKTRGKVNSDDPGDEKDPKLVGDRVKEEPITKETFKAVKDK